jgi:predicted transcriptional regulator
MFRVFVLFSSPRSRKPPAWRRASGSYVMGGQAEGQGPTLLTGRTHVTPDRAYLVEKPRHLARCGPSSFMLCSYCMRLTVHLPDDLARLLKQAALNEGKSMSALTAEALALYLRERRRRALGLKVLERAGKAQVDPKALEALEEGRRELDRP